jgi:hypothetical protein
MRFPLAPMSPAIRWLTLALWLLPALLAVWAAASRSRLAWAPCVALVFLYAGVWLACRPSSFEVSASSLDIVFPIWTRSLPASSLRGARLTSSAAFRQDFGWALRIGVGGLWGGFGWLWTSRRGLVEFYVSRVDGLLLVEREAGKPLLITPGDPEGMRRALGSGSGRG